MSTVIVIGVPIAPFSTPRRRTSRRQPAGVPSRPYSRTAMVSTDFVLLKDVFSYTSYPFGVALDGGREKAPLPKFDDPEPAATLRQLGFAR